MATPVSVVVLDFADLAAGVDLSEKIRAAYGEDGLGKRKHCLH